MPRRTAIGDEWEDDPDDEFDGDSDDDGADDESETVPCPYCRRPIHEDAERCPIQDLRAFVSRDITPRRKRFLGRCDGRIHIFLSSLRNMAHDRFRLCWTADFARKPVRNAPIADEERIGCSEPSAGASEGGAHPLP